MEKDKKDYYSLSELKFNHSPTTLEYISNSKTFIVGDKNGKLFLWDIRTFKPCKIINTEIDKKINYIKSNSDQVFLFSQYKGVYEIDLRLNSEKPIIKSDHIKNQFSYKDFKIDIDSIDEVRYF